MFGLFRSSDDAAASAPDGVVVGVARVDRRTKNLTKRLRAGEIAIIDHEDLDRVSAEALVRCEPAAVLNASRSTSGRYPNLGPQILRDAGVPHVDDLGPDVMGVREGSMIACDEDGHVYLLGAVGSAPSDPASTTASTTSPATTSPATTSPAGDSAADTVGRPAPRAGSHTAGSDPTASTSIVLPPEVAADGPAPEPAGAPRSEVDGRTANLISSGTVQSQDVIDVNTAAAREGLSVQLEAFAENTMDYLRRERDLLLDGIGVPDIRTDLDGRHVLVVVRGYHYKEDLASLRSYIREYRPVLVGVDGGADAILEMGHTPHMIVGDMDSVSDRALTCGAEIIVHAYRNGRAPGRQRVEDLGVEHVVFPATGTSEDVAMLLADDKGAELIVALGTHATLIEFLDKGRAGMASTFLTRLRVGSKLVDAKGVSQLYRPRIGTWQLWLLALAGLLALFVSLAVTPVGQTIFGLSGAWWDDFVNWLQGLVT